MTTAAAAQGEQAKFPVSWTPPVTVDARAEPCTYDTDPFADIVDADPADAILGHISRHCLNGACFAEQARRTDETAMWAAEGGRITPAAAASLILERMGCPYLREK